MKNRLKVLICLTTFCLASSTAFAEKTELYALDGRTMFVDESQVELYTADSMGWFLQKPVTMYALDGRSVVVPANQVEAYKKVGWYLKDETNNQNTADKPTVTNDKTQVVTESTDKTKDTISSEHVAIKYTDGTVIKAPSYQLDMYKALGWTVVSENDAAGGTVTMYDSNGVSKEVPKDEVSKYELAGWSKNKPDVKYVKLYSYDGSTKDVPETLIESYKSEGLYPAYDEAVYAYAAFGNGKDVLGASELLKNKKYEQAFNMVQDALDKIENTDSQYVPMLHYLRSMVTDAWREAANSPLGFINYWFSEKDGKNLIVFEYRNVSNSRIQSFKIDFVICDKNGKVIETNKGSYVENLQMTPCEKKRVAWVIKSGDAAASIKELKVSEVVFSDNTKWVPNK